MATSPDKNIFFNLYSSSMKNYVSSGYVCDRNAGSEMQNSVAIDDSKLSIVDGNGTPLTSIDLSHIAAGGGAGSNSGSSTIGGSITEYTSQTKILQPKTAYLIQGQNFGLCKQETCIKIPREVSDKENFERFFNVDFDIQYIGELQMQCFKVDTSKIKDDNKDMSVDEMINLIFETANIPATSEIINEDDEWFLKFTSIYDGIGFTIYNVNGYPIYQNEEYIHSPFTLKMITAQDVIDAIADVQPTPFRVVQPVMKLVLKDNWRYMIESPYDETLSYWNERSEAIKEPFVYDYDKLVDDYNNVATDEPPLLDIGGEDYPMDINKAPITLKFTCNKDMVEFKKALANIQMHAKSSRIAYIEETKLIEKYQQKYECAQNYKKAKQCSCLDEITQMPGRIDRDRLKAFDARFYNDNSEDEYSWVRGKVEEVFNDVHGLNKSAEEYACQHEETYAYPVYNKNDVYTIDCNLYFFILANLKHALEDLGNNCCASLDYSNEYVHVDTSTGKSETWTITYNPKELKAVYEKIVMLTGVHTLDEAEREEIFRMKEDFDKAVMPMLYPNGAMRGLAIAPVYPEGYVDLVKPLRINFIKDKIEILEQVDKVDLFTDYIDPCKKNEFDMNALTKEALYRKMSKKVLCSCNSIDDRSSIEIPVAAKTLFRSEALTPSMEMSFRSGISPYDLYQELATSDRIEEDLRDNIKYGWKHARKTSLSSDWDFEKINPVNNKEKDRHIKPECCNYVGMQGYLSWVEQHNDWIRFKTFFATFGGVQLEQSNEMQLVPSVFIFNPNDIPVKINFLIFA